VFGNPKSQASNPKQILNHKSQCPKRLLLTRFGRRAGDDATGFYILDLVLGICLEFGIWDLDFGCGFAALG
jgi:hypothetical protein